MRLFGVLVFILAAVQACSTTKLLPVEEINYSDGINESEAKSLAYDHIKKNKKRFCQNAYVYKLKNINEEWHVLLGCDTNTTGMFTPYSMQLQMSRSTSEFRDGGVLVIDSKNGNITRTNQWP